MHPAARLVTIIVVIVLICSHLVLNLITDKPLTVVSRQKAQRKVSFGGVEGVNELNNHGLAVDAALKKVKMEEVVDVNDVEQQTEADVELDAVRLEDGEDCDGEGDDDDH